MKGIKYLEKQAFINHNGHIRVSLPRPDIRISTEESLLETGGGYIEESNTHFTTFVHVNDQKYDHKAKFI